MDRDELLEALWYGFPRPDFMHSRALAPIREELVRKISMALPSSDKAQEISVIKEGLILSSAGTGCWNLNKPGCLLEDNYPSDVIAADGLAQMLGLQLSKETIELKAELVSAVFYKGNQVNKSLEAHKEKYFATMVVHFPFGEGAVVTMSYGERSVQGRKGCAIHTFFGECKLATTQGDPAAAGSCLVFGLTSPQVCEASPSFLHALVRTKALLRPWLEQTDPMVLAFVLPRSLLKDCDKGKLVIVELLRNCGLELHYAKIRRGRYVTGGHCEVTNWEAYNPPIADRWKALDGTKCFPEERLVLHNRILVQQSGITTSEAYSDAPVLVAWPAQKRVQAVSLIDFSLSLKLLREGSSQDVEALSFLVANRERGASSYVEAELLSLCLDWKQKDLALHLLKHVEGLTESLGEPLARAVATYGWEECDGDRLVLGTWKKSDLNILIPGEDSESVASLAIHLESCGCHPEAVKVVDQLAARVRGRRYIYFPLKARIILLPRMLEQESLQEILGCSCGSRQRALQVMRNSAGLIRLRDDDRMIEFFKELVRSVKGGSSGEAIESSLWLGDASLVDEVMNDLTGGEDYVGELLEDDAFTSDLSTAIKRRGLRRLLEMRLAFWGSTEPEYRYAALEPRRLSYAEAYSEFKRHHMRWVKEVPNLKELLQVLDAYESHPTFYTKA